MKTNILLEISIRIEHITEVCGGNETVSMVYFSGSASSQYFKGEVMPGAVDTQIQHKNKPVTLSARYVLEGVDCDGNPCKIFIENNGIEKDGDIITKPCIITDSPALKWLETIYLSGKVFSENNNLVVRIYSEEKE